MDKKILKWNFVFQYGWVLTNILNALILLPLYLKNIDTDTLGIWLATGSILSWMVLVDPGIGEVLQQQIAELRGRNAKRELSQLIGSGFIASAIIFIISALIGLGCYFALGLIIKKDVSQYPHLSAALVITIIATGLSLISFTMSGINQGFHNSANVAIASLAGNFVFLATNIVLLYAGMGVLSIAFANLIRSLYINLHNVISMRKLLQKQQLVVEYQMAYFKNFIRIFSFTSTAKIISGLAYSVDMIILARYIPPSMITIYEINKRPINMSFSLIGRHSVALMPLISHAKGTGDKKSIINLVTKQFKIYCYAVVFVTFIFLLNYQNLITVWTGKGQYAGNTILYLLTGIFFFGLLATFMSSVDYALGDIKQNSVFNIARNIIFGVAMFFSAKYYGITGTLVVSLFMSMIVDCYFYTYRVYKLGYLTRSLFTRNLTLLTIVAPLTFICGRILQSFLLHFLPTELHLLSLVANVGCFSLVFLLISMLADKDIRNLVTETASTMFTWVFMRRLKST